MMATPLSYAVAMIADVDYNIGVDIVYTNDKRLERIANRTMSDNEIEEGNLPEIWALKEAVLRLLALLLISKMK